MRLNPLTRSTEDFVRALYGLQNADGWVNTTALATRLGQRPSSVTNRIQRLAREEGTLVEYVPYQGVRLNATGTKVALELIRHHRLIELYLAEALGVPWDEVHDEAERLEHALSETVEARMAAVLNNPRVDPHGSPIPTKEGLIDVIASTRLSEIPTGATVRVVEVHDRDAALLRHLGALGLYPGSEFRILGREPFGRSLRIRRDGQDFALGEDALPHVRVTVLERSHLQEGSPHP